MQQLPLKNYRNHHRLIQSGGSFDGIQVCEHRSRDNSKQQLIKKQPSQNILYQY